MKKLIFIILILFCYTAWAQATFIIETIPDYTPPEDFIYIAGSFNDWNGGDDTYQMYKNTNDQWQVILEGFASGSYIEYKFTRGSWNKVEKGPNGEEIPNRQFTFGNGDTIYIVIENWADMNPNLSTAAENVVIMDDEFYMPQLDRYRRIWLYLPPDYETSGQSYPVIYMHDGQNLFDAYTSGYGEWEVDETLNDIFGRGHAVPIVVGIDHGGSARVDELTPWYNSAYGGGEGDEYLAFIVETLKPYIDTTYRTLPDRENTGIMGSSLGGLISTYGAIKYQDVFSRSGPFSPAYWINNDSIWDFITAAGFQQDVMFYQNVGELEGDDYIDLMYQMRNKLIATGFHNVMSKLIPDAAHNEQTWRDDFEEAYFWLFREYADIPEIDRDAKYISVFPNPCSNILSIKGLANLNIQLIEIINNYGQTMKQVKNYSSDSGLDISELPTGSYLVKVITDKHSYTAKFIKR